MLNAYDSTLMKYFIVIDYATSRDILTVAGVYVLHMAFL